MRIPRRLPNYPMGDNEAFYFGTDNDVNVYWDGTYLTFRGVNAELSFSFATAGETIIYGGITAGDDLTLRPNTVDTYPFIRLYGAVGIYMATGVTQFSLEDLTSVFTVTHSIVTPKIKCAVNNKDFYLETTGTGVLQFGTYTAGAALASDGYITIKDAAGATRKLMVQA